MAKSGVFGIFKGKGAAKFSQIGVRRNDNGWVDKNGAVLLEAAPVVGKRPDGLPHCDWGQKISFAIGVPDVCNLLESDPKKSRLFHKNERSGTTKSLQFIAATDARYAGTYMMHLSERGPNGEKKISVPFSAGEYMILQRLLVASTQMMLGWE